MANSFEALWAARERERGMEHVASRMIPFGDDVLPSSAAPCLSFDQAANPRPIYDVYGAPFDWSDEDRRRLQPYSVIGSDGSGNPICIDAGTGEVILLDHEDAFRTSTFINSSTRQLRECLLAYFGEEDPGRFNTAVSGIDPPALGTGTFWSMESGMLGDTA